MDHTLDVRHLGFILLPETGRENLVGTTWWKKEEENHSFKDFSLFCTISLLICL